MYLHGLRVLEAIKRQTRLQTKVRELGLGLRLGCTLALSVTHSVAAAAVSSSLHCFPRCNKTLICCLIHSLNLH